MSLDRTPQTGKSFRFVRACEAVCPGESERFSWVVFFSFFFPPVFPAATRPFFVSLGFFSEFVLVFLSFSYCFLIFLVCAKFFWGSTFF